MKTNTIIKSIIFASTIALVGACASDENGDPNDPNPPEPGNAYLTVVGEQNLFMENGWEQLIEVRYHDGDGEALAGQIDFEVVGASNGGNVSAGSAVTNADGIASVRLVAGAEGDASFKVEASAEFATSAQWNVAVTGTTVLPPMDPTGTYNVISEFDMVSGLPGTVGDVVNGFVEMTDDPNDPATWLIDLALEEMDNSTVENIVNATRPFLDGVVNDLLMDYSPDFVAQILEIGDKFGQVAREFGTDSSLEVVRTGGIEGDELVGTHTMHGIHWTIDGTEYSFSMPELSMTNIVASELPFRITEDESSVIIGDHAFPLSYGSMLIVALNEIIIPLVNPGSEDLYELLADLIDCSAVGQAMSDAIGFGSPGLYEGACVLGINAGAGFLIDQIESLDGEGMVLGINGDAKPMDTNTDSLVDVLLNGEWAGDVTYAGNPAPLSDSSFRGDRMALP